MKKMTHDDVRAIRACAEELQRLNAKHFGHKKGVGAIRARSERAAAVADKLEKRLRA